MAFRGQKLNSVVPTCNRTQLMTSLMRPASPAANIDGRYCLAHRVHLAFGATAATDRRPSQSVANSERRSGSNRALASYCRFSDWALSWRNIVGMCCAEMLPKYFHYPYRIAGNSRDNSVFLQMSQFCRSAVSQNRSTNYCPYCFGLPEKGNLLLLYIPTLKETVHLRKKCTF